MSSASSSRASRRQVLAVGPVAMESGIGVDPVGSIFEALGIIAKCPASRPVDAVLLAPGDGETLEDLVHAAQALRRLDATVQVILVGSQPLGPSIAEQFDGLTPSPIDEQRLKHVLDGVPISDAPPAASTPVVVEPPSAPEPSAPPAASTPPTTPPPIDAPTAPTAPTAAETPSGLGRLGDTDLVEAMLHDASGVLPVALRLILQQTGWSDCAVSMEEDGAPIRFGSSDFGQLVSADQPTAALRPWANWLARWLALDEAQRELRDMAFRDELTTAWNRRYLASFLEEAIEEATKNLNEVLTPLTQKLYPQAEEGSPDSPEETSSDENTVDAEFEEVKEEEK